MTIQENRFLAADNKVKLIGFSLNADTYAMQLLLKKARIPYDYEEVNMLKGEHESEEFEKTHPCKYLPILQDGNAFIYGGTFIMITHLSNRFKKEGQRIMPKEYVTELSREYSAFEET
jgi:glutathione S-transferase